MLAFDNVSYFDLPYPVEPWEYAVSTPVRPDGSGLVRAPKAPGLGLEVDWERLRSLAVGEIVLAV